MVHLQVRQVPAALAKQFVTVSRLAQNGGVAIEKADRAGAIPVQQAEVLHVLEKLAVIAGLQLPVPGDVAGVIDRHRTKGIVVDAAVCGRAAGQQAVADRHPPAEVVE